MCIHGFPRRPWTRTSYLYLQLHSIHDGAGRIGAGALDYDFGALDDADNTLARTYPNLMLASRLHPERILMLTTYHRHPRESFGHPGKLRLFAMNVAEWLPRGIITLFLERSKHPMAIGLRENREESRRVARTLIDQKRRTLTVGGDILSLLGSCLPPRSWNGTNAVI